jgi:hypothetical protein
MDVDSVVTTPSVHGLSKAPSMKTVSSSSDTSPDPIEFEASGVGGVHPFDNFALNVKSRHELARETDTSSRAHAYPAHIRAILDAYAASTSSPKAAASSRPTPAVILASKRKDLPPSELPPPSYFPMSSAEEEEYSDDDDDDDEDSEMDDEGPMYSDRPLPSTAPQAFNWPTDMTSDTEGEEDERDSAHEDEDDDNDDSDGSVDLLVHARKVNPEVIRLAEREYDSTLADRLADEIPAGSSAATAGGGSGFNSPNSPVQVDANGKPMARHASAGETLDGRIQQQRGILKRSRPSGDGRQQQQVYRRSKSPKLEKSVPM